VCHGHHLYQCYLVTILLSVEFFNSSRNFPISPGQIYLHYWVWITITASILICTAPHPTATTPFNAHKYIRIYMGCLASKSTVTPKYKYTRKSQGLEEEQWVEVNARKQLLPGLLERVRPAFQSMLDEGKSYKDMFLAFDEDGE
jgi:hypothetical protein